MGMKLHVWMVNIQYLPGTDKGLADAPLREEITCQTVSEDGLQSGAGGYGGAASTMSNREEEPVKEQGEEQKREQ